MMRVSLLLITLIGVFFARDTIACGEPRTVEIDGNTIGFGTFSKLPRLPLKPGEFVLTFDDGPVKGVTNEIIEILKSRCVPAAFFMIGKRAEQSPEIVRSAIENGFEVGTHSYSHKSLPSLSALDAETDVRRGIDATARAAASAGPIGSLFRFPNFQDSPQLYEVMRRMGLTVASADISPEDWRGDDPLQIFSRFRQRLQNNPSGVIVLHANQPNTVSALPMIIDEIERLNGTIVGVRSREWHSQ